MRSTNCDYAIIGDRIKHLRKAKNYTQEQLAEMINISPKNISQLERGKMGISVSTLMSISKALQISADYLLFGVENGGNSPLSSVFSDFTETERFYAERLVMTFAEACGKIRK